MVTIIIPARYGSKRLPGKPLALINGIPMIQRVYNQCVIAHPNVYVATDDRRIADLFPPHAVLMTSKDCKNGTERCAEAAEHLGLTDNQLVVNIQGDMPYIPSRLIQEFCAFHGQLVVNPLSTVATTNPLYKGSVRVVTDQNNMSLFFSRQLVAGAPHVGIYGYSVAALRSYVAAGEGVLERIEQLEQLRWLDGRRQMHVMTTEMNPGLEINTPDDLIEA